MFGTVPVCTGLRQRVGHAQTLGFAAEVEHKRFLHSVHLTHSCYVIQLLLYIQYRYTRRIINIAWVNVFMHAMLCRLTSVCVVKDTLMSRYSLGPRVPDDGVKLAEQR